VTARRLLAAAILPLAAAMTLVASTPWLRAFPPGVILPILLLASVISVAIPPLVATLTGRSVVWSAGASFVVLVIFSLLVVLHDPTGISEVLRGFTQGVARLLSIALPVSAPRWLFIPPVVLCWLVGAVSSELLTRSRTTGLAPLAGIVGFSLAYAATAGAPGTMVAEAVLLGLSAGFLLFVRRWLLNTEDLETRAQRGPSGRALTRPLVLGTLTLAVAAVVCALVIPQFSALKGAAKAPTRTPPTVTVAPITPTVGLAELRGDTASNQAPRTLFSVRMNKPSSGYLAAVDLDSYDGDIWSLQHTFEPTGGRVRLAAGTGQTGQGESVVDQHYKVVNAPDLPWMPYLDQPTSVSGVGVDFDNQSGMIIPTQPLDNGQSYSVTSATTSRTLATLTPSQLRRLSPGSTRNAADSQPLAGADQSFDNVLTQLESETGVSSGATLTFLRAVEDDFRTKYRRVPTTAYAPTPTKARTVTGGPPAPDLYGTSLADIQGAVFGKNKTGTPEQFATLVTLLARKLGIPARLVTGYRLSGPNAVATPTRPNTDYQVTNLDAWAWVEIYVPPLGWVVVDPTPTATGLVPGPAPSAAPTPTTVPPPQIRTVVTPGNSGHAVAPRVNVNLGRSSDVLLMILGAVLILAILVGLVPVSVEAMKARRRRRRRSAADPGQQVEGAWLETLDVLYEARVTGLTPLTNSEVASVVDQRFGQTAGAPVAVLATAASAVAFSTSVAADADMSGRAWSQFEHFRRALKSRQSRGERNRSRLRMAPRRRNRQADRGRAAAGRA
jgi:TgpA N-terminal domain/Transglutaminase-like superfamily